MIQWWLTPVEFVPEGGEVRAFHNVGFFVALVLRHTTVYNLDFALALRHLAKIPLPLASDDSDRCMLN
jgi:hypothetical protein